MIFTFKGISLYAPLVAHPHTQFLERLAAGGLPDEGTAITTSSAAALLEQSRTRGWKRKGYGKVLRNNNHLLRKKHEKI